MNMFMKRYVTVVFVCLVVCVILPPAMADTEANKESCRRVIQEAWSQGQLDVVDEVIAPEYVYHEPALGDITGPEGLKQAILTYRTAYPDLTFTIDDIIAEGDLVSVRWTCAGTQKGELMGIPATGLETTATGINVVRFADDKAVEEWGSWDVMGLMQQLGVVTPARPGPEDYLWTAPSDITGEPGDPALNKLLVLRYVAQFWNGKDIAGLEETHHSEAIGHNPSIPGLSTYDSYKQACLAYLIAFPDFHVTVDAIFAEADKVVVRWTATGTQQGELLGIPASGKAVTFTGMTMYRMADDKIAETWWAYDALGVVQTITSGPEYSPDGTWVVTVPTEVGNITFLHTVSPQEKPDGPFAGFMVAINENPTFFGIFPEADGESAWLTTTIWTGRNKVESTMLTYGTQKGEGLLTETVYIAIARTEWTLTGPNTNEGTAVVSLYTAEQDADGNGLPDIGAEPVACLQFAFTSKRLNMMPGCVPTPMPEQQ